MKFAGRGIFLKHIARFSLLLALLINCPALTHAQGFKVESKTPAETGAETFFSIEGRFSIALPGEVSEYKPEALDTPTGRVTTANYNWRLAEGFYSVNAVNGPDVLDTPAASKAIFNNFRQEFSTRATAAKGKLTGETSMTLAGHPGFELRAESPDGHTIQRIYLSGHRVYLLTVGLNSPQPAQEATAAKILDSFKMLSEAEVEAAVRQKIAAATPAPLPQEPVAKKLKTDAQDEGLKGKVKTVFTGTEHLSGISGAGKRQPSSMEYYNEQGNLTGQETYDYQGNPMEVTVYGYLDGDRASHTKDIEYEYNPPAVMITTAPGEAKSRYDPRYSYKFKYKYDDAGRLVEEIMYGSNGKLWLRYVYKYKGTQKESLVYDADGALNQKYLYTLDDKGNTIEESIYEISNNSILEKDSYSYEFDPKGNWTKRIESKLVTKDGKTFFEPAQAEYRTIVYY
jgi:hypothetical protein